MMVFFLSIGLLVDLNFIYDNLSMVLILLFVITIGKTAINIGILHLLRLPWSQSFLIGVVLAQLGEFAFLMASVAYDTKIIDTYGHKLIIALTVLSLALSPLWLSTARRLKRKADENTLALMPLIAVVLGPEIMAMKKALVCYLRSKITFWRVTSQQKKSPDNLEFNNEDHT